MKTQLIDLNPTTRCFPRSRMEAYKVEYMSGIEYYKRPPNNNSVVVIFAVLCIIAISILMKVI
jgi:hypothetical protein